MEYKLCPILNIGNANNSNEMRLSANNGLVYCLKAECEWWDKVTECCIVHALSCFGGR